MDKFLNNRWAVKIIALLFALLLYVAVNNNQAPTPKKPGESFFRHQRLTRLRLLIFL